jgi:hypothetical protein
MKLTISSGISVLVVMSALFFAGCEQKEEQLTAADATTISEETVVDYYFQDVDDLGSIAIATPNEAEYSGGRTSGTIVIDDDRFECDGVVVTITPSENSNTDNPQGVLTVDFGTAGCEDLRGNVRKGKLIINYTGWWFESGSTVTTTTENYSINGIKLQGTRTSTNITASVNDPLKFHVTLTGSATFEDGSIAERESDITWSWIRGANPALDKLIVHDNSTASGTTRNGRNYAVSLMEQLEYHRFCGIAVSGIKKYVIDGDKEISVDYGDGGCDRTITISLNGVTKTISI